MRARLMGMGGVDGAVQAYNLQQDKMIPLSYADQIVAGSFEYALNEIVEQHPDLTDDGGRAVSS